MAEKKKASIKRHLPEEMVEEILLNLPVKSLLRFSSVSKAWSSMISQSSFVKRYRTRGREKNIVLTRSKRPDQKPIDDGGLDYNCRSGRHTFLVSSISSSVGVGLRAAELIDCPFEDPLPLASCEELWLGICRCGSLCLSNPSMRSHKTLPKSSIILSWRILSSCCVYGLGYDSLGDDYKILRIPYRSFSTAAQAELYSLRSDSWRKIADYPTVFESTCTSTLQSVSGNLHWLSRCGNIIHCFDLSTEKFGEVAPPANYVSTSTSTSTSRVCVSLVVLNGMLGLAVSLVDLCDVWVMEDYGVAASWTKKFSISGFFSDAKNRPLYFYQNGDILVQGKGITTDRGNVFVCRDRNGDGEETSKPKLVNYICRGLHVNVKGAEIYVDSLVAPAMWSSTSTP